MSTIPKVRGSGWMLFAGVMALLSGGFNSLAGFAMLTKDEGYFNENGALYGNVHAVGSILLVFGLALLATSFLLLTSNPAGRVLGIVLAALSALFWFTAIGTYPLWGGIALVTDVAIILGLTFHPYDGTA